MDRNLQIIPFQNLKNRMVQTDEATKFRGSFFKEVYDQAAALTNIIAMANENSQPQDEYLIPRQQTIEIQNVIAFSGRRGTGKTSAMLSFADAISEGKYADSEIDGEDNPYKALKGKRFYALQYVDSSTVFKDEDFFELLLYRMLQYLKKYVDSYDQNKYFRHDAYLSELKEEIFQLYNHYNRIKYSDRSETVSSYSLLEKNIEKHNVRNEIIKLVKEYLKFLSRMRSNGNDEGDNKNFLVICIDDIDMASSSRLEILQCIYQYFMIPNVIVMITLNEPVITATVKKEVHASMEIPTASERDRVLYISQNQTNEFIRKIIPPDMRITMPSWKKYDYRTMKPTMISFEGIGDEQERKKLFPDLNHCSWYTKDQPNMSPKALIMLLLADRTKIFLDMAGLKIHFMEPDSLRNLYDLFYMMYDMKNINEEDNNSERKDINEKYYRDLEYNRTILLNYLYFKMIPAFNFEHLLELEFKDFQGEPMDRRGRRIWDYYYKALLENQNKERIKMLYGDSFLRNESNNYRIVNYCFGELFRCLYFSSRLDLFNKNFVKAVLASFAFTLPQFVETEKRTYNEEIAGLDGSKKLVKKQKMYFRLRDVFGYSFLGTWRKDLYYRGYDLVTPKGCKPKDFGGKIGISITINKDIFNKAMERNPTECIKHLIYLFLLSTKSVKQNFNVTKMPNCDVFYIDAALDPTAFIVGTVRIGRLTNLRFTYETKQKLTLKELFEEIKIEKYDDEIFNKIIDEFKQNELVWFLLKHQDITYNVIKRTVSFFLYYSDATLQVRPVEYTYPYNIFKKFYSLFVDKFVEELQPYEKSQFFQDKYDFQKDKFDSAKISPILKWFINTKQYGIFDAYKAFEEDEIAEGKFFQYGCGLDWSGLADNLKDEKSDYSSKRYQSLEEAVKLELDDDEYASLCNIKYQFTEKASDLNRNFSDFHNKDLKELFEWIYTGQFNRISDILKKEIKAIPTQNNKITNGRKPRRKRHGKKKNNQN